MEKKTFLGLDITPRKKLWEKIQDYEQEYNELLVRLKDNIKKSADTYNELKAAKEEIDRLREKLSHFNWAKDKLGRFIKHK